MNTNPHRSALDTALASLVGARRSIALCTDDCMESNFNHALCALRVARQRLDDAETWIRATKMVTHT